MIKLFLVGLILNLSPAEDLVEKIQDKFEKIKYLKADFSQVSENSTGLSGKFYFSKENYYRIELPNNIIISDGESIWNEDIRRSKVVISSVDEDPLAFSFSQYIYDYPEKCKLEEEKTASGHLLYLDAKDTDLNFKSAKLWINNEYLIEKILVIDHTGNPFTLQFQNLEVLNSINESLFKFTSTGIKVIDLR